MYCQEPCRVHGEGLSATPDDKSVRVHVSGIVCNTNTGQCDPVHQNVLIRQTKPPYESARGATYDDRPPPSSSFPVPPPILRVHAPAMEREPAFYGRVNAITQEAERFPATTEPLTNDAPSFDSSAHYIHPDFRSMIIGYGGGPAMLHSGVHMQLAIATLRHNEHLGLETHEDSTQCFFVLEGEVVLAGYGARFLGTGGVAIVPPGALHDPQNFKHEAAHLLTVYVPKEHPNDRGKYAKKYRYEEDYEPPQVGTHLSADDPVVTGYPAINLRYMEHPNQDHVALAAGNVVVRHISVGRGQQRGLAHEGYYYVIGGVGHVRFNDLMHAHGTVKQHVHGLGPGSMFYLPPDETLTLGVDMNAIDATAVLVLALCSDKISEHEARELVAIEHQHSPEVTQLLDLSKTVEIDVPCAVREDDTLFVPETSADLTARQLAAAYAHI